MDDSVFISGSAGGIGNALLIAFAKQGCKKIIAHARSENIEFEDRLKAISDEFGVEIEPLYFDLLDCDTMKSKIGNLFKRKIYPTVLVNNAGVAHGGFFQMTPISEIEWVFNTNLFSAMRLTQLLLKGMARMKRGSIVNIASTLGLDLIPGSSAYGVSKAAMVAWTKVLASELGVSGIRANAVAPGLTDTTMGSLMESRAGQRMVQGSAMKRLGNPVEVAEAVVFLASDKASFINGQVVRIDGGAA